MMKFLGIDYGSKRVGIALSDDEGVLAFPNLTFINNKKLLESIKALCKKESVSEIVLGESYKQDGTPNAIMGEIKRFKTNLENQISLPVHLEAEFMTSMHADILPEKRSGGKISRGKNKDIDASAATLILQRFLDKR